VRCPFSWLKEYLELPETAEEVGQALTAIGLEVDALHSTGSDVIFEISLTPNLAHCLSIRGIARELATFYQRPLQKKSISLAKHGEGTLHQLIHVEIQAPEGCPRYAYRIVRGLSTTSSPAWLQERLEACGLRSVNLVVDATNFVMLDIGHPLHAFDYQKLSGQKVIVRGSQTSETILTLDGISRSIPEGALLICDADKPIALAGIMGSQDSEVDVSTTDVFLEAAYFTPAWIRRTAKKCGVSSEASYRFERGVDPLALQEALDRVVEILVQEGCGSVIPGTGDMQNMSLESRVIQLRLPRVERILGVTLASHEILNMLSAMDVCLLSTTDDVCSVAVPLYRHDLKEEIDLIEEIARFYRYDNLHPKEPAYFRTGTLPHAPMFTLEQKTRRALLEQGLQELLTCDLISPQEAHRIDLPGRSLIHLLNPKSVDQSVLRPSLLPGHLTVVKHNHDHQLFHLCGFEVGRIHFKLKDTLYEQSVASVIMTGRRDPYQWQAPKVTSVDFFALKGVIEVLLHRLHITGVRFEPSQHTAFHPGRQASITIHQQEVGVLGEVHPYCVQQCGITQPVYYAELNLDQLVHLQQPICHMRPLPQFPSSTRDWTVTVDEHVPAQKLLDVVLSGTYPLLEHVSLLDVYRGENVASDRKSITLRFIYRDQEKTVAQQAVDEEHARVTQTIVETLNRETKR